MPVASWPLVDQGMISLGTFLFNIVLARAIPLGEYGHYAMALGILLLMQATSSSLIFYPLSVRGAVVDDAARARLMLSSLVLTAAMCVPLTLVLGMLVWWFVDTSLLLPAFAVLLAGQLQEALRRGLLAGLRHRAAIAGDAIRYLGQVAVLAVIARHADLDLPMALYVMAATSLAGAGLQLLQVAPKGGRPLALAPLVADFWWLGKWSLTSNLLGLARTQCLPWMLGSVSGPAAAGAFQIAMNIYNLTTPIVTGVCNIVPQAAARALPAGYRAAWRASWPYIATGMPIIVCCCLAMLIAPGELVALFYGDAVDSQAIVGGIRVLAGGTIFAYASTVSCAYLHGVNGGRDGLVSDLASTAAMLVLAAPLTMAYGLAGGCAALCISLAVRTAFLAFSIAERLRDLPQPPVVGDGATPFQTLRPTMAGNGTNTFLPRNLETGEHV